MADILLSVGMQTGSAETKEFINQLKSVVNGLNSAEDIKAKVGMQIDTTGIQEFRRQLSQLAEVSSSSFAKEIIAGMQGIGAALRYNMEQLNDMSKMLDTISKKDFTTALDFSGLFKGSNDSDISAYKHKVTTYINTVKEAYDELARVTGNVRGGKSIASSAGVNVTKFFDQVNELASNIGGLRSGVNLKSNNSIGKLQGLAQSAQELITPLIPLFNELKAAGATDFDISKILTIPEAPVTNADVARQSLIGLADAFKQFQQTMSQTQQVPQQIISDESIRKTSKQTQTIEEQEQAMWDAFNAEKEIAAERAKIVKNSEIDKGYQERASQIAAEEAARKAADQKAIEAWYKAEDEREKREDEAARKRVEREEKNAAKRVAEAEKARAAEEAAAQKQAEREERTAAKRAAEAEKASERAIAASKREEQERVRMLTQIANKMTQIDTLMQKTTAGTASHRNIEKLKQEYSSLFDSIERKSIKTADAKGRIDSLGLSFAKLSGQIKLSSMAIQPFGGGLSMLFSRINYYLSLSNMILQAVRAVKQMVQTTTELDTSLTQLQIVTRVSNDTIHQYGLTAARTAQEIGGSTKDLIDSATVFARLGYTLDESNLLSKYTNMLQNVGAVDASTAQNAITAIVKAFDIDVDQIELVMDKMVEVGNNFPISVSEIAEGMNNAGSALHAAGNSFEQSVALLTAANTTVQNISKSSTGLRTIAARIRKTTVELDDLGETIEEAKYQEVIDLLTGKGVKLTENGSYRTTYDILKDIASIWKDLSSMERAGVAEQLAGTRQQNIFYSIIEQFSEASDAMVAMQDSAGALENAYAVYADSIQGHINTFKASFDELSETVINSDIVKGVVDIGSAILNVLTAVAANGGKAVGVITSFAAAFLSLRYIISYGGFASFFTDLFAVIPYIWPFLAGAAGIAAAIAGITAGVNAWNKAHPTLGQLTEDSAEAKAALDSVKQKLDDVTDRIEELNNLKSQGGISSTESAELDFLERQKTLLEAQVAARERIYELKHSAETNKASSDLDTWFNTPRSEEKFYWSMNGGEWHTQYSDTGYGGLLNAIDNYKTATEKYDEAERNYAETADEKYKSDSEYWLKKEGEALNAISEFQEYLFEMSERFPDDDRVNSALGEISDFFGVINGDFDTFKDNLSDLPADIFSELGENAEITSEQIRELANSSDELSSWMQRLGFTAEDVAIFLNRMRSESDDASKSTKAFADETTNLIGELDKASKALEKYKESASSDNGSVASGYADAYKKFLEDWNAGRTGSKSVQAAIELFIPDDVLRDLHYDVEKAGKLLASDMYQSIFNNENSSDYGKNFANFLRENIKDLDAAGVEIKEIDGGFSFAYESLGKLAYALGMSEDAVSSLLDAMDAYSGHMMMSTEDTNNLAQSLDLVQTKARTTGDKLREVANELASRGNNSFQVREIMLNLREAGYLNFNEGKAFDEIIQGAGEFYQKAQATNPKIEVDTSSGEASVESLQGKIDAVHGKTVTIGVVVAAKGLRSKLFTDTVAAINGQTPVLAEATGTKNAPGGPTLVNELGPEIISENGTAYIAGGGMPTVVDLDPGAVVLNADDTKKALRGTKHSIFKSKPIRAAYRGIGIGRPVTPDKYVVSLDEFGQLYDNGMGRKLTAAEIKDSILKDREKNNNPTPKKDDEKEKQKFDWIVIAIDRIQRAVSKLQKVASNTFKKLDTRLSASKKAVQEITKEIDIMQAGYERYLKEAESVGLDSGLAELVRNGTIDINEYDEDTKKLIQDYQNWYEKALDCRDAIDDLHQSIAQLYLDNFNNAQKDFENKLSSIEHAANMVDQNIAMADARGYLESAKFYDALSGNTVSRINTLKSELSGLKKMFNEAMASGEIEARSEAWYQMSESIAKVEEELASANVQLEEYKNKIREINWSYFDYAQSRIDQITDEASFLIELMSNKELFNSNGGFSDYGTATLGMHVVGYDTAMAKADEYAEELKRIERELANDPYDTALIERREELIGLQQKSILNAESEKNAVRDLVEEGINKELDALRDLIDAYNDSLDSAKDLYEYQKKVAKQTEDIASLEKQLAAYQNDTSQENRARVQKLQQQLREARTTLQETERDKSISDQKKLLDDLYNDYEEHLNHRLDNIDALMEEMISVASVSRDEITQTIEEASGRVGYTITDGMRTVLGESFSSYNEMFDHVTGIHTQLSQIRDLIASIAAASGATKAYAKGGLIDYTGIAAVHGSPGNPEMVLSAADTARFLEAAALMRSAPKLSDLASSGVFTGSAAFSGTVINGLTISIPIDHVQDYNDMISQMQRDPKFDRLINAITLDRVAGKSQMGKYGVRF